MNHDQIEGFAALLRDMPKLTEIDIRHEGLTLRLRRNSPARPAHPTEKPATVPLTTAPKGTILTAQHVGVFLTPSGRAPQVGDLVKVGQILGQLDTMRLLSDCQATITGRVQGVFVENGQPVEYGQPLFEIQSEVA